MELVTDLPSPLAESLEFARLSLIAAVLRYESDPTEANAEEVAMAAAEATSRQRLIRALRQWRESRH